jgi:hypothetical protein
MTEHHLETDIASIADRAIVRLGVMLRNEAVERDAVQESVRLCDALLKFAEEHDQAKATKDDESTERRHLRGKPVTNRFPEEEVSREEVVAAKSVLENLLSPPMPSGFDFKTLETVQSVFARFTMPFWRSQMIEFQYQRDRQRLRRYG